ncbi:MAG: hypothetical protein ABI540_07390 [Spartobacteria bacterium]
MIFFGNRRGKSGDGGGYFDPEQSVAQICDTGRQSAIRQSDLQRWLNGHPRSFVGSCQITPATSR